METRSHRTLDPLVKRRALQGVRTIVRFNWPFFVAAGAALIALLLAGSGLEPPLSFWAFGAAGLLLAGVLIPLAASWCAYDLSGLYGLRWLDPAASGRRSAAHIHAGFDEITALLRKRYPQVTWRIFDFYDPDKHTEPSIRRARRTHPPAAETVPMGTDHLPAEDGAFDLILLCLAAHEIRDSVERIAFFAELRRCLSPAGIIVHVEHVRDLPNLLAYSLGAWHFHTKRAWEATFTAAHLRIDSRVKINPFMTCYRLGHDGTPS